MNVLKILKETGSILEGHFLLSSGLHSPNYVQCALALKYPEIAKKFAQAMVKGWGGDKPDLIISPALGGIIIGYEIARLYKAPFIFTERENGETLLRRGFKIKKGEKAIIVEDVFTTGKSTMEVFKLVSDYKAKVIGALSIIDRMKENIFPFKTFSLLKLKLDTYNLENCPLCRLKMPIVKPGSRKI